MFLTKLKGTSKDYLFLIFKQEHIQFLIMNRKLIPTHDTYRLKTSFQMIPKTISYPTSTQVPGIYQGAKDIVQRT